jgi:hypothetical protein
MRSEQTEKNLLSGKPFAIKYSEEDKAKLFASVARA